MAIIYLNGRALSPSPRSVTPKTADLHQNATRAGSGVMVVDLIRSNLRSFSCEWSVMMPAQLKAFYDQWGANMFNQMTFPDPVTGARYTGTFYRSDVSCGGMVRCGANGMPRYYRDVKIEFIER